MILKRRFHLYLQKDACKKEKFHLKPILHSLERKLIFHRMAAQFSDLNLDGNAEERDYRPNDIGIQREAIVPLCFYLQGLFLIGNNYTKVLKPYDDL